MISSPVPTVNRIPLKRGFQKRTRFTSLFRASAMRVRHTWLLDKKRSKTDKPTTAVGGIFGGAGARLLCGEGSMKLRINHPPNHPGMICSTGSSGLSFSAAEIAGKYASFVMHQRA